MPLDNDTWRTSPLYSLAEAARLANVSTRTVRRWLYGYETGSRAMPPVFGATDTNQPLVSFLQLAEIVVASRFRKRRVTLGEIRSVHAFARKEMHIDYPFATLRLDTLGGRILHQYDEQHGTNFAVLGAPAGVYTLPGIVTETLYTFDYIDELAARWYPMGKNEPIVVDPLYSAGVPTIMNRRVTAQAVVKRFRAGHAIRFIAKDLKLTPAQVEAVIRFADKLAA